MMVKGGEGEKRFIVEISFIYNAVVFGVHFTSFTAEDISERFTANSGVGISSKFIQHQTRCSVN